MVGIENEARFILALQQERSAVALAVFLFNDTSTAEEKVQYIPVIVPEVGPQKIGTISNRHYIR